MDHLICRHCDQENCLVRTWQCQRHLAIRSILLGEIAKELPKLHVCYTEAEKEWNENE